MLKKLALSAAAAAVLATGATAPVSASAATVSTGAATVPAIVNAPPCKPHQVGKHWACITPGSFCPVAAKNKDGFPDKSKQRYRCTQYPDHKWRWKRA